MTAEKNKPADGTSDREITLTRVFDAPRALVWEAWTDPKHVDHWMGPRGYLTRTLEMNARPGGRWRYIMRGPDGTDYDNRIAYLKMVPLERLVYDHGSDKDADPDRFRVTVTFEAMGEQTRLTMHLVFATAEACAAAKKFGAVELGYQTLDRLGEKLANLGAGTKPFTITREFDAPRDVVFKAWTDREHLMHWWGPKGMTMVHGVNDLRPGGSFHYCLRSRGGDDMWGKWVYRDLLPPARIVFVNSFSDPAGNIVHHPAMTTWPLEMLLTIDFVERAGRTQVTITSVPINPTPTERRTFEDGHASMRGGWGGSFDVLADYLRR